MVMEEQIENGTFAAQNSGGPLKVTKMLAAVATSVSDEVGVREIRHILHLSATQ
jgi:hypothetical protein